MKKIALAVIAAMVAFAPAAEAGNKHWHHNGHGGNNWHGGNHNNWHGGNHNNWHGGHNNYYHGGHNNYYHGGNNNFYNDPNFWWGAGAGLLGGVIGGAIVNENRYYEPQCVVQPYKVWDDYQGWVIQYRQICN